MAWKNIIMRGVDGVPIQSRLANIWSYKSNYSIHLVVATLESMQEKVLIERDNSKQFYVLFFHM